MSRTEEFADQLLDRLMPPGSLLSRDPASKLGALFLVIARELERLEAQSEFVVRDLPADVTSLFLLDWERTLGTPDCSLDIETTAERRQLVLEKLTRPANLTLAMIEAVCLTLGFNVTVTETATPHQFDVDVPSLTVREFRAGESTAGDRLGSFGVESLECVLDLIKPAHTTYTLTTPP